MVTTRSGQSQIGEGTIPHVTSTTIPAMTSSVAGIVSTLAGIPIPTSRTGPSRARNVPLLIPENLRASSPPPNQPSRGELIDFIRRQEEMLGEYARRLDRLEHEREIELLN
ncbi:hypothetical protein SESBI_17205 [Sesbania bispinosa]|nr:hypothetical protein SESBI_17205 [Sesbania bispinosa]